MTGRALVIDDVAINRQLAIAMLRREGWEAEEADCGQAALEKLVDGHGFGLVLLDISMPGMTGEEVCQRLRQSITAAGLPIIAYTAHALEEDRGRLLAAGFDAVLIKPISREGLKSALTQALAARASR